ncbi:syncollin [Trachemys scripta elegans]|uniref:syncollin n=1 Tax=Trachemys scripta elegans TaxID=31138 RepID=UPI001556802D|nr:syncollin [Trachemys scripta elegans]
MATAHPLLLLPLLLALAWAQCPAPADLKNADGSKICAQLYTDDSPYYAQCCGGNVLQVQPGDDVPYIPLGWNDKISSLVVAPRCDISVWSRKGKKGYSRKFNSGVVYRLREIKKGLFGDWDNSISAYYCKCN